MDIISGTVWGRRFRGMPSPADHDIIDTLVIHYTGNPSVNIPAERIGAYIHSIQEHHLGNLSAGWVAIAYNFLIDKDGRIWEGRGPDLANGANRPANRTSLSVCLLNGVQDNTPTPEQIEAVKQLRSWLESKVGRSLKLAGHKDYSATACPGESIYAAIQDGTFEGTPTTPAEDPGMQIVNHPTCTIFQAQEWARSKKAHGRFIDDIIPAIIAACDAMRVQNGRAPDPAVVIAQAAKETGWGRFTGVIGPERHNTAGIKIDVGGGDFDADAHETFSSWREGARAHVNHLGAYCGLLPVGIPHGRYHTVIRLTWAGNIRTVEQLGARWAPSGTYGQDIVGMVTELQQAPNRILTGLPAEDPAPAPEERTWLVQRGDSYWRIADRALGDGRRYQEVGDLNRWVALHPGMIVQLP